MRQDAILLFSPARMPRSRVGAVLAALCIGGIAMITPARAQTPATGQQSLAQLLATADAGRGATAAKICKACHTLNRGGGPLVGPNLWGVIGRAKASQPGFSYSPAMQAKGGSWTVEELDQFITKPNGFIPGTKMPFAGVPDAGERADIITYLNSLADSPSPLPQAAQASGAPASQ